MLSSDIPRRVRTASIWPRVSRLIAPSSAKPTNPWTIVNHRESAVNFSESCKHASSGHNYAASPEKIWNAEVPFAEIGPLRIMWAVSMPARVAAAE